MSKNKYEADVYDIDIGTVFPGKTEKKQLTVYFKDKDGERRKVVQEKTRLLTDENVQIPADQLKMVIVNPSGEKPMDDGQHLQFYLDDLHSDAYIIFKGKTEETDKK